MKVDYTKLKELIDSGHIKERIHYTRELRIFNYTNKCTYENNWNDITMSCRGLITDKDYNVLCRPFKKFFNIEEINYKVPEWPPKAIFEKFDGSLGILYKYQDKYAIATRGSFDSPQAKVATDILNKKYKDNLHLLDTSRYTFLFEIITSESKVVVNYDYSDIVLLAVIDTETGKDVGFPENWKHLGFKYASNLKSLELYSKEELLDYIKNLEDNTEGIVLFFNDGTRLKVKSNQYIFLHKIYTQTSNRDIWKFAFIERKNIRTLLTNKSIDKRCRAWIILKLKEFRKAYRNIDVYCHNLLLEMEKFETRKDKAEYLLKYYPKYSGIVFNLLDNKDPYDKIVKLFRPEELEYYKYDNETSIR